MTRFRAGNSLLVLLAVFGAFAFHGTAALLCAGAAVVAVSAGVLHEINTR